MIKLFKKEYTYFFTFVITENGNQIIKSIADTVDFKIKTSIDIYNVECQLKKRLKSSDELLIINYIRLG